MAKQEDETLSEALEKFEGVEKLPPLFKPGTVQLKLSGIDQQLNAFTNKMAELGTAVQQITGAFGAILHKHREDFEKATNVLMSIANIPWAEIFERQAEAIEFAAEYGWFIQPSMPLDQIARIAEYKKRNDPAGLDEYMKVVLREQLEEIEAYVLDLHPDRTEIVEEAFKLHRENRYVASIPLFISQAEGIGYDRTKKSAFSTSGKGPEIAPYIHKNHGSAGHLIFAKPLTLNHPLSKFKLGRVNRHRVLHGRDLTYGTELGSLQAISFLGNIAWILSAEFVIAAQSAKSA